MADTSTLIQEPPIGSATSEVDAVTLGNGPQGKPLVRERVQVVDDFRTRHWQELIAIETADAGTCAMRTRSGERLTQTDRRGWVDRGSTR